MKEPKPTERGEERAHPGKPARRGAESLRAAEMAASAAAGAQGAVEEAIRIAQDAVRADEAGDFDEAVELYTRAVDLIKRGLQIQREDESVDNTVLHRYAKLYSCLLYTSPSPRDQRGSRMPSSA